MIRQHGMVRITQLKVDAGGFEFEFDPNKSKEDQEQEILEWAISRLKSELFKPMEDEHG